MGKAKKFFMYLVLTVASLLFCISAVLYVLRVYETEVLMLLPVN